MINRSARIANAFRYPFLPSAIADKNLTKGQISQELCQLRRLGLRWCAKNFTFQLDHITEATNYSLLDLDVCRSEYFVC